MAEQWGRLREGEEHHDPVQLYFEIGGVAILKKNSMAFSLCKCLNTALSPYRSTLNQRFPVFVKYVHGGEAL